MVLDPGESALGGKGERGRRRRRNPGQIRCVAKVWLSLCTMSEWGWNSLLLSFFCVAFGLVSAIPHTCGRRGGNWESIWSIMDGARHRREREAGRAADADRQRQPFSPLPCLRLLCITRSFNGNTSKGFPPGTRQGETERPPGPPRKPGRDGRNPDFRSGIPSELLARRHTHTHTHTHTHKIPRYC